VSDTSDTQLTRDTYDRLQAELVDLTTRGRVEIAAAIETARALGDLKENGDYHAAKDAQGKMESRIRMLQRMLKTAIVVDGEKYFAIDPIAVKLDEISRGFRQFGKLLGRVSAVEAFDEAPDFFALADEFAGKKAKAVNLAFIKIGFDKQHEALSRGRNRTCATAFPSARAGWQPAVMGKTDAVDFAGF